MANPKTTLQAFCTEEGSILKASSAELAANQNNALHFGFDIAESDDRPFNTCIENYRGVGYNNSY